MAQGDIFKVIQKFTLLGVDMLIRRFLEQLDASGGSSDCLDAWYEDVVPPMIACMSSDCELVATDVINLDDTEDFTYDTYTGVPGTRSGIVAGAFDAWGFIWTSSDRKIRSGGMRLPGVAVADISDGAPVSAELTLLNTLATAMGTSIFATGGDSSYGWRLYTPGNVATSQQPLAVPLAASTFERFTTQNTRKPWRP